MELAIKTVLEQMSQYLVTGDRIEIRGLSGFSLYYRAPSVRRFKPKKAFRGSRFSAISITMGEREFWLLLDVLLNLKSRFSLHGITVL